MHFETAPELTARYRDLMLRACPSNDDVPFFNRCMQEAKARRLPHMEALEYAVRKREEL